MIGYDEVKATQRIGLFGGTFDPVHNGHLAVAHHITEVLQLDALWFIPAAAPPHKDVHKGSLDITPFTERAAMLKRAIGTRAEYLLSPVEKELPEPSYTIDTLREIRKRLGTSATLFFLIGIDAFVEIFTWKDYEELPKYASLVVVSRPSCQFSEAEEVMHRYYGRYQYDPANSTWRADGAYENIYFISMEPVAASSSEIRKMVSLGKSVQQLVPHKVAEYIKEKKLYQEDIHSVDDA